MPELKRLHKDAIPAALEKAERYRLLNEPGEAESICLDILDVDPDSLEHREIMTGDHCFGCTAGAGSSCGGALV